MRYLKNLIAILMLIALGFSAYIYYTDQVGSEICLITSGCSLVRNSAYAEIFGMKLSLFGVIALLALLGIHFQAFRKKLPYKFFLAAAYISALFSLYFLYLQFVVIKAVCSYCLVVDFTMLLIASLATYEYFKSQTSCRIVR